jgi:hypothetical protein
VLYCKSGRAPVHEIYLFLLLNPHAPPSAVH